MEFIYKKILRSKRMGYSQSSVYLREVYDFKLLDDTAVLSDQMVLIGTTQNRAENYFRGISWINSYHTPYIEAPWGGYKQSGIGRELGTFGYESFTEIKQNNINLDVKPVNGLNNLILKLISI